MEFSCLISCFYKDSPLYLKEALQSICRQTLLPNEIIFVEDGLLTDELNAVVAEYLNLLPIKIIKLAQNRGLGFALNYGLLQCNYDVVLRMDTDDVCMPTRFEEQIAFLKTHPDVDIVGTWAKDINENGDIIGDRSYPTEHEKLYKIMWACPMIHPSVGFKKQAILKVGSYNINILRRQDYDLWMRAASEGLKFANIPRYLLYYRFTSQYYKKNSLRVTLLQAKIGIKGIHKLGGNLFAYVAVISPVIKALLPIFIIKLFQPIAKKLDPRT